MVAHFSHPGFCVQKTSKPEGFYLACMQNVTRMLCVVGTLNLYKKYGRSLNVDTYLNDSLTRSRLLINYFSKQNRTLS